MLVRRLWEPARTVFSAVGVVTCAATGALAYAFSESNHESLPDAFVIELDLDSCKIVEKRKSIAFEKFQADAGRGRQELELRQVVDALHVAAKDPRVAGLLVNTGAHQAFQGLAHVEELRNAILHFRNCVGERAFTVAHSTSFGEGGCFGTLPYYFASACDKVFMQPSGLLSISGISSETWFVRGLLDKWKIKPHWFARERYKNVISPYIEVQNAINAAPLTSEQAVSRRLIDGALYRDEIQDVCLGTSVDEPMKKVKLQEYIDHCRREQYSILAHLNSGLKDVLTQSDPQEPQKAVMPAQKPAIAVLTAAGQIICGPKQAHQKTVISSVSLCRDIAAARDDPSIKALVLRIDSPGGSAVASDSIYREVVRTREAGKPVVVSMGNMAASGGYYIASPASIIVAQPSTITGSIGVVFGKFNISGLLREYGINPEAVQAGTNATAMSWFSDFTRAQARQVNDIVDYVYDRFILKVAEARRLPVEDVRKIAKGRMWSGVDALALGLVDQLGGLQDAIRLAKELAQLPLDEDAVVVREVPASNFSWLTALQTVYHISTLANPSAAISYGPQDAYPNPFAALFSLPQLANTRSLMEGGSGLRMEATGLHFPWDT